MKFQYSLRAARETLGLSRSEAAKAFGIPIRTIEDWESGRRTPPQWAQKLVLADMKRRAFWEYQRPPVYEVELIEWVRKNNKFLLI